MKESESTNELQLVLSGDPEKVTLGDWLEDWLEHIIRPNREDTTYYGYKGIVRNHMVPAMGRVPLLKLEPRRIQAYYSWLRMERRLSANTVYKHHILFSIPR